MLAEATSGQVAIFGEVLWKDRTLWPYLPLPDSDTDPALSEQFPVAFPHVGGRVMGLAAPGASRTRAGDARQRRMLLHLCRASEDPPTLCGTPVVV